MDSDDLRHAIQTHLATLRSGSLSFWGHWFGKPYDNIHRIVGVESSAETVVIHFDRSENLILEAPTGWSLDDGCLCVRDARLVRFDWFYYGKLPSRETLRFVEYRRTGNRIAYAADFMPGLDPSLDPAQPAVQLHTLAP